MSSINPSNSGFSLGQVGPQLLTDGNNGAFRQGRSGELVSQDAHGKFYEACSRGAIFSGGMTALTSISNATFTIATLGATATPIIGLWNPATSLVNLVVIKAMLMVVQTALQNTGCGGFSWATST